MTCSATTAAPRSCASLTAVATISSPISPSFIGTRIFENSACGSSVSTTEATWVESIQCSPSNSSRFTVFQYVWRDARTRSTSRPSRGHVIGP